MQIEKGVFNSAPRAVGTSPPYPSRGGSLVHSLLLRRLAAGPVSLQIPSVSFLLSFISLGLSDSGLFYDFKVTGGT